MSEPVFDDTTERVYARLPSHFRRVDPAQNYSLKKYIAGTTSNLQKVEDLIKRLDRETPEETSDLTDPHTADLEWLPWLGQLLGVRVRNKIVDETTRNEIVNASNGYKAGTDSAIIAAVQSELVGSKSVKLLKRTAGVGPGGPWDLMIQTLQSETLNNVLPSSVIVPTSIRSLRLYSSPIGYTNRILMSIARDEEFYKSRAIEFRAVTEGSGIGSESGQNDDGFGEDEFGAEAFGTGDAEETTASEFYFYTSSFFDLDHSDPLTTMMDASYVEGSGNILVSAGIELFNSAGTSLNIIVGSTDISMTPGDFKHITGRNESIPATATQGKWIIRVKNVGQSATLHVGHFGARKENVYEWVVRTSDPIQAILDRGAKPAGLKLWHSFASSSWNDLENGGTTTWNDLEALPDWVAVEEYGG